MNEDPVPREAPPCPPLPGKTETQAGRTSMPGVPGRIGRYEVRRLLGRGGMGMVYLAHDPELDRPVAIKVPQLDGPEAEERFLREARAAAAVSHPNLCPVYDAGRADGLLYLAMAYVPGPTLARVLRADGALPAARAAAITAAIARGMAEAHRHGVIHRDLKPGNVLLSGRSENQAVVTDFGIAGVLDAATQATGSGTRLGTLAYMAPEQLEGGQVGRPADLWALGATLYHAVEGRPPFTGTTLAAVMVAIRTGRLTPPEHAGPLRDLIEALLAADPASRPDAQSAAAVLAAMPGPLTPDQPPGSAHSLAAVEPEASRQPPAGAPPAPSPRDAQNRPPAGAPPASTVPPPNAKPTTPPRRRIPVITPVTAAARANPRLAVGLVTAVAMVLVLILVTLIFPSKNKPGQQSPGTSPASPATSSSATVSPTSTAPATAP